MLIPSSAPSARVLDHALIVTPADPGWDEARRAWNLAVDQRPAAVAVPQTAEDIVVAVQYARENGLRVAAQGTGHNATPLAGHLENTLLIKTHLMCGVEIDADHRVARVEAGTLWMDVNAAAGEHGLAALAGSSPDVGVVGYTLGGGVSWLSRRYGMACSRLLAVELVTAEGRRIRADRSQNADLFHAMQGGGGAFGVVTAMEFELLEVGPIQAGILFFPIDRAPEVLEAWRRWSAGLPDTVATVGRFMRIPPMPEIPEPLRGREFVVVEAAILGTPEEAHMYLEPIRALGAEIDTVVPTAPQDLQYLHMDPPHPIPGIGDHLTIDDLTADAVTAFIDAAGADSGSTLLMAEMILASGKGFPAGYLVFGAGLAGSPEQKAATRADLRKFVEALKPYAAHRQYLNFSEHPTDPAKLWDAETLERLRAVKAGVDPEGVMVSNHPIG